ncbi:hypothetical protein [Anabaena azotica]|uniref:Uncharacterized protein n=1 Tax=Anabaena azotica FACHB-119 TaxID=947527 RepID=A0ABR8CZQ8_9NOST|nr:hypothetical protein [Anabaena azotica]MBD2499631.1 hypothetical protein [Anabaena azotica FACHB-119]
MSILYFVNSQETQVTDYRNKKIENSCVSFIFCGSVHRARGRLISCTFFLAAGGDALPNLRNNQLSSL